MVQGQSYLQLYYNKACTKELEKDTEGNYIYNSSNISNNAIMPLIINLWCKNNGSHTAYETTLTLVSSDLTVELPLKVDRIASLASLEVIQIPIKVDIPKGDMTKHIITLRFEYDSI